MSRSRWYERRKGPGGDEMFADFRARRDDWRSWAPMAIPNRRRRKSKRMERIEHVLYLIRESDRVAAQGPNGASDHRWARVYRGETTTNPYRPLTTAKAAPCCFPRDDAD